MSPVSQALLVIDVQTGLFTKNNPIFQAEELLANINRLIKGAREKGIPVIFIQHCNPNFLQEGTEGWRLHPSIDARPEDMYLKKKHSNAFQDTPLAAELKELGINTIVVVGLVTHGCVKTACIEGKKRGFKVILVADGHSSWNKDAEKLIAEWNEKLSRDTVELKLAREVFED